MALALSRKARSAAVTATPAPAPGVWRIDPAHSAVELSVRHLGVARVRGRFTEFGGTIEIAEDPLASHVDVEIRTASIDTGDAGRDQHLRSADFFAVDEHPTASFRSHAVVPLGGDRYAVDGELTIRGVTRPLSLELSYGGTVRDPYGNERIIFGGTGEVNREEFGLTWNQVLETGGVLVGSTARLEIDVEAVREA